MAGKKSHTSAFYLIDAHDYNTFSELRQQNLDLQKQITELMKYRNLHASAQQKVTSNHTKLSDSVNSENLEATSSEPQQIGSGSSLLEPAVQGEESFQNQLFSAFQSFLKSNNLSHLSQVGSGQDVTPQLPIPIENPTSSENSSELTEEHTESGHPILQNTETNKLVSLVIPSQRSKAQELLQELGNHTSELSFSENGPIVINGEPLNDSNITNIFPMLFRPIKNYENNVNLSKVVDEIASLGLGHLISRHYTRGLTPKGKSYLKNRVEFRKSLHPVHPWYYISENE